MSTSPLLIDQLSAQYRAEMLRDACRQRGLRRAGLRAGSSHRGAAGLRTVLQRLGGGSVTGSARVCCA